MEKDIRLNWQELVEKAIRRRKQQKLIQKQLAVLADVSHPTVNSFEQRKKHHSSVGFENSSRVGVGLGWGYLWYSKSPYK